MFKYIKNKLGIAALEKKIDAIPVLNERYLNLLTPMEAIYQRLLEPEGDDSLVMFHLRSMGLCGGWRIKEIYETGKKHGANKEGVS